MILTIIGVLLILSAMKDWSDAEDWERAQYNAELRHREKMDALARIEEKARNHRPTRVTRRRFIRSKNGEILAEEIIIDEGYNLDEDDWDEDWD